MKGSYIVQLTKLDEGLNRLEFDIDSSFFQNLEYAKIKEVEGKLVVEIEKSESTHKLWLQVHTKVRLSCDRCNELIFIPVNNKHELVIKQTDEEVSYDDEDIISLGKNKNEFDLAPVIYDIINISIPLKVSCDIEGAEKKCDEELLAKLNNTSTENNENEIDPRWEKLKILKNN